MKKELTAKFYKDIEKRGDAILVYEDPTGREFSEIEEDSRWHSVRFFMQSNGKTYAWDGAILHSDMEEMLPEIAGPVHFEFDRGSVWCYITPEVQNAEMLEEYLRKFPFSKYGYKDNCRFRIDFRYYGANPDESYEGVDTLHEFYENVKMKKERNNKPEEPKQETTQQTEEDELETLNNQIAMDAYINEQLGIDASKKSRLKRVAEFFDGIMQGSDMLEIYKNPTAGEFSKIIKKSKWHSVRFFEKEDGTVYAWDSDVLHDAMGNQKPGIKGPVHFEIFDDGQIDIFIEPSIADAKMLKTYLDKLPLSNYGVSKSSNMNIDPMYYKAPNDPIYGGVSIVQDFYDLLDGKKELYE